jgi:hypothetical protein
MPSATGQNWEKYKKEFADDEEPEKKITPLTDEDIQVLKTYGAAPYAAGLKRLEKQIKEKQTSVNEKIGLSLFLSHNLYHGFFSNLSQVSRYTEQLHLSIHKFSSSHRNQIPVLLLHIFGISPPTGSACPKITRFRWPAVRRSSKMKRTLRRASMLSTSSR